MVGIKILVLLFFIVIMLYYVRRQRWRPTASFSTDGMVRHLHRAAVVLLIGFDAVSTVAEETKIRNVTCRSGSLPV
jgi:amino acid transporter